MSVSFRSAMPLGLQRLLGISVKMLSGRLQLVVKQDRRNLMFHLGKKTQFLSTLDPQSPMNMTEYFGGPFDALIRIFTTCFGLSVGGGRRKECCSS